MQILKDKYDFEEDDFLSAEIEVVPAGKARDYGFDRSMIMSYGQDDRVCAYTSLAAMLGTKAELEKLQNIYDNSDSSSVVNDSSSSGNNNLKD